MRHKKCLTKIQKGSIISIMLNVQISVLGKQHLPLNSGWSCSRPSTGYEFAIDSGGFGK
jgi:hypothetical protein